MSNLKIYSDFIISQLIAAFAFCKYFLAAIKANSVLNREVKARWRTNKAFFVVFSYAIILAVLAFFNYMSASSLGIKMDQDLRPVSFPGREMFIRFNQWQMAAWAIFAPLLTASAIAGEREGGQLDSLLLSHLTPYQIAWGKWTAAMAFVILMLLVPLPVGAICFQLGGVSPYEFLLAALLQLGNAALCAAVGLYYSANCSSTDQALGKSLVNICLWGWLGPLAIVPAVFLDPIFGTIILLFLLPFYYAITHAVISESASQTLRPVEIVTSRSYRSWLDKASDVLTEQTQSWQDCFQDAWDTKSASSYGLNSNVTLEIADGALQDLNDSERYKRWDMPGAEILRFENPVLQREVRRHLRLRAEKVGATSGDMAGIVGCFLSICFLCYGLALLSNYELRPYCWGLFSTLWLPSAVVSAAMLGAGAFTRERAARMLDFLWITRLTKSQVYWGKLAGAIAVVSYYSLALVPVLLPCLMPRFFYGFTLPTTHIIGTLLLVFSAVWASATWGLLVSWLCQKTFVATAITLLGIWLSPYLPLLTQINPVAVLLRLFPLDIERGLLKETSIWTLRDVFEVPTYLFVLGLFFALITLALMNFGPQRKDDNR